MFFNFRKKKSPDNLYILALNAIFDGQDQKALKLLRKVVTDNTDHIYAYIQIGNILRSEGNYLGAIKIHQSLTVRPNLDSSMLKEIHRALAIDFIEIKDFKKAEAEANLVLKFDKKNLWANKFLLNIYEKNENWISAIKICKIIDKLSNGAIDYKIKISKYMTFEGKKLLEGNFLNEATKLFDKSKKIDSLNRLSDLFLGNYFHKKMDKTKAIEHWMKYANSNDPDKYLIYNSLINTFFETNRFDEVEVFFKKIIDINPEDLHANLKLINFYEQKGNFDEALTIIKEYLKKNQNSTLANLIYLKLKVIKSGNLELNKDLEKIIENELEK